MNDCCCSSPAIQSVSVPGISGADGAPGLAGADGISAFATLTSNLVVPAVGQTVTAALTSTAWMAVGMPIFVSGNANFTVSSISSPVSVILLKSGAPGDLATGTTILAGAGVSAGSNQVNAYTITTNDFTVPATVGATVNIHVATTRWMGVGQSVLIGASDIFTISSITSDLIFVGTYADVNTNVGFNNNVVTGSKVVVVGLNGVAGYSVTTTPTTIPNVGATVTADVASSLWMAVGQIVILSETATPALGNFQVVSFPNAQQAVLKFLGYLGDSAAGVVIASGARVSIGGSGRPAYATTTSATLLPATAGSNVVLPVDMTNSQFLAIGSIVTISETTNIGNFQVVSFPNDQSAVLKWLGYPGDSAPGVTIASGARVSIAGLLQSTSIGTLTAYGAGTAYDITTTPALIGMGTTTPAITLATPGTYALFGRAIFAVRGMDGGPVTTYTLQIQAQISGAGAFSAIGNTPSNFSQTSGNGGAAPSQTDIEFTTPPVIYTTTTLDVIQLWVNSDFLPVAGTPKITYCSIVALKLA